MISLNTYSFAINMGLIKNNKKNDWKFLDFVKYAKQKKLKGIEFPIDFFSKKENQKFDYFFKIAKKNNIYTIIDLEEISLNSIRKLIKLYEKYEFKFIRVKMSNLFGGNRHIQKNFNLQKKNFLNKLNKASQLIGYNGLKILIENHQDLSSKEIIDIIKKNKFKNLGINWDIGNSLPTCETPLDFFNNAKKYIYNVHCKDYKVILSSNGYFMKRTTLGNGIINFKQFSRYFKKKKVNISIELAAHITRHSQLFDKNFSKFHTISKKKLKIFKNFIKEKSINENPLTLWELENDIYKSSKQEKIQFNKSLQFLKTL